MRSRSFILVTALLLFFVVVCGAVYAYDHSRRETIANGVRVGGIDLGGLSRSQAEAKLQRLILDPLERPIVIHHGSKTWRLTAREAHLRADLGAMVDEAVARSRQGNILQRTIRGLTDGRVTANLTPTVDYSDAAIIRTLDRVRHSIERPARNASAHFTSSAIRETTGQEGLAVEASPLHKAIRQAIVSTTADRTFVAKTRHIRPKVSNADLAQRYGTAIIVNRNSFRLTLFRDFKPAKTYSIAVGMVGLETPAGLYNIQDKQVNPAWHVPNDAWAGDLAGKVIPPGDPENPIKARWMGIYNGAGIHGTAEDSSIGSAASHGCIRMHIPDVEDLYNRVSVGTPVYIV